MLQRIQSIWLFFASASAFATLKFSTYSGTTKDLVPSTFLNGTFSLALIIATLVVGILSLVNIFLYNNRKLQFRLTIVAIIWEVILIALYYREAHQFMGGAISITALLHALILLFLVLAAKGINHDEQLIKSSNRLR